jgi:23S rRNA (cytosine1962-C5)-methyltransferase
VKRADRELPAPADGYELLDSGGFQKLERFGSVTLARPCAQAIWRPRLPESRWRQATACFTREGQKTRWAGRESLPEKWDIVVDGLKFRLSSTDFGHLGIFPEQRAQWRMIRERCAAYEKARRRPASVLNLFAYSGGSTLAAAMARGDVCHVDASKGMVEWARENAALNGLAGAPIRWIVDDVTRFTEREARRARRYDLVILDPPSYGRGARGEVFKIDTGLDPLLDAAASLISDEPIGVLLTCHTPELTPIALSHLLRQHLDRRGGSLEHGEMLLRGAGPTLPVPNGSFAWWEAA